jgi:hypothetical protein
MKCIQWTGKVTDICKFSSLINFDACKPGEFTFFNTVASTKMRYIATPIQELFTFMK